MKKNLGNKQQKLLDGFLREWSSKHWHEWIDEINEKLWHANLIIDEFKVPRKVGRPKKPKKSRGGQKRKGCGED